MGKSSSAPPAGVDYNTLVPLQGAENRRMVDYTVGQSRVNQIGPGGRATWSKQPTYDNAAFEAARSRWNAQYGNQPGAPGGAPAPAPAPGASPPSDPVLPGGGAQIPTPPGQNVMFRQSATMPEGPAGDFGNMPEVAIGGRPQPGGRSPIPEIGQMPSGLRPPGTVRSMGVVRPLMTGGDPGADGTGGDGSGVGPGGPGGDPGGGPSGPGDPGGSGGGPSDPGRPSSGSSGPTDPYSLPPIPPQLGDFLNYEWTQTTELSPEQQQLYDRNVQSQIARAAMLGGLTERANTALSSGFDASSLPARPGGLDAGPAGGVFQPRTRMPASGEVFRPNIQAGALPDTPGAQVQDRATAVGNALAGFSDRLGALNPAQFNEQAADALYRQTERYLNPQVQEQQRALESRLAEQGFVPGTPAYDQAIDQFRRSNERSFADARDRALTMGTSVGNQAFGNSLQAIQSQIATALQGGNFGLSNDQARSAEALRLGEFGLSRQGQNFGQQVTSAGLQRQGALDANQVADTDFRRSLSLDEAGRIAQLDANQAAQQLFDRQLTAGNFNNANRERALAEALTLRSLPLNELNALASGTQVSVPQFSGIAPTPNAAPVDILGAAQQDYAGRLNSYNAGVASDNATMASIAQILASGLGYAFGGPIGGAAAGALTGAVGRR